MAATYPATLKSFTNPIAANNLNSPSHSQQHIDANDEIVAIETELGLVPKGSYATVRARLDAILLIAVGTPVSKTDATAYQAATDGFVQAYALGQTDPGYGSLIGYTDSSATPTTIVVANSYYRNSGGIGHAPYCSISFFVKKNNYYMVSKSDVSGSITEVITFTPLG